jgi:hypothetical protein
LGGIVVISITAIPELSLLPVHDSVLEVQATAAPEPSFTCGPVRALPAARYGRIAAQTPKPIA